MSTGLSTPLLRRGRLGPSGALCALLGLAACGGGGGGGDGATAPSATSRVVAVNRPAAGQFALNVVDPDRPSPVALRVDFGASSPSWGVTRAWRNDAAARTTTSQGPRWLVYVQGGRLMQVPLDTAVPAVAVAVASMADACSLEQLIELDASGRQAWAVVDTAGADGLCSGGGNDNARVFVRVGDDPSAGATPIAPTVNVASGLRDADGRLLWMLAQDGDWIYNGTVPMPAFRADLQRADVAGVRNIDHLGLPSDVPLPEGVFIVAGPSSSLESLGSVRLLEGDAAGLRIGAPLKRLAWSASSGAFPFRPAGPHLYVVDGLQVQRIAKTGGFDPVGELDAADGTAWEIADQTDTHLVVTQRNAQGDLAWSAVAKAGGAPRVVLRSTGAARCEPLLLSGRQLYYRDRADAVRGDIRRVDIVSGDDATVRADTAGHGIVRAASESLDLPRGAFGGTALLFCQPQAATGDCRGGRLQQLDPATGAVVTLGSFAGSSVAGPWSISAVSATAGSKGAFVQVSAVAATAASRVTDIYAFEPGRAGSLQRVTTAAP